MNFNLGGLGQSLSEFGQKMRGSLSNGLDNIRNKWESIPQEKKSAFAQQMEKNAQQQTQAPQMFLPQMQDYSWALQPTMRMGQQYYGN